MPLIFSYTFSLFIALIIYSSLILTADISLSFRHATLIEALSLATLSAAFEPISAFAISRFRRFRFADDYFRHDFAADRLKLSFSPFMLCRCFRRLPCCQLSIFG